MANLSIIQQLDTGNTENQLMAPVVPVGVTYEEFVADKGPEIEQIEQDTPERLMSESFEKGLSGDIDFNNILKGDDNQAIPLIDVDQYTIIKDAKAAEDKGTATPDQETILQQARDPQGELRLQFDDYYSMTDLPMQAIDTGGNFPIDPTTGKMIPGESLPPAIDIPIVSGVKEFFTGTRAFSDMYSAAEAKAQDGKFLVEWMNTRSDAPSSPVVRDLLTQSLSSNMIDLFGERIYSLASALEGGVMYHLPNFSRQAADWAANKVGVDTDFTKSEANLKKDLIAFKNSAFFEDRQQFVNSILRDQMRLKLGDAAFETSRWNEKVTIQRIVQGVPVDVERFKYNFVDQEFADALMEAVFDSKSLPEKVGVIVAEGYALYNLIARPFTAINNAQRYVRREFIKRSGKEVPFTLESTEAAVQAARANVLGVPIQQAAKELALANTKGKWWHKWRANSIAQAVGDKAAVQHINSTISQNASRIDELKLQIKDARSIGNSAEVARKSTELARLRALNNWGTVRKFVPGARRFGIHPTFDVTMGLAMVTGRNIAEGPIGEFYGAVGFFGLWGVKSLFQYNIGFLNRMADGAAFKTRVNTERLISSVFALGDVGRRGFAEGWLVNPNLKTVLFADDVAKSRMSATELNAMRSIAEGFKGMPAKERSVIIEHLDTAFNDVDRVVSSISEYITDEQAINLRKTLSLTMAQASGTSVYFSVGKSMDLQHAGLSQKDLQTATGYVRNKITFQVNAEKQVATLGAIVESLDSQIMEISETMSRTTDAPPQVVRARVEALDRLKILSGSFKGSYDYAVKQLNDTINDDLEQTKQIIEELSEPSNVFERDAAMLSGQIDSLIEIQNRIDNKYRDNTLNKGGFVEVARPDNPSSTETLNLGAEGSNRAQQETELQTATDTVRESIQKLQKAIIISSNRSRLPSDAADITRAASMTIQDLHKITNLAGDDIVTDLYLKVSDVKNVELDVMGSNLLRFFEDFKADRGDSIAKQMDPTTFRALGGRMGEDMIKALDGSAGRGLKLFFSDEQVIARVSESFQELDLNIITADDAIRVYKEYVYGADPQELANMGVKSWEEITDLKLALRMMEDTDFEIVNPSTLRFIASPRELETLRQSMLKFGKSPNNETAKFAKLVVGQIDNTFRNWGQGLNVDDYNDVARARMAHRVNAQRNDVGTFGNRIDKATSSDPARIGEGEVVTGTTRDIAGLLNPLIKAVMNPTADSPRIIEQEMKALMATFAPVTSSLPESVLSASAQAGKIDIMEAEELAGSVTAVMDGPSYDRLRAIITVALKNAFFEQSNMKGVKTFAKINKMPLLPAENMPKPIAYPESQFDNVFEYLASIQDSFIVNVDVDGTILKGQRLFDIEDILMQDRSITDVINAVEEYRVAHADLLSLAKTEVSGIEADAELLRTQEMDTLKKALGGSDSTVGEAFVANVLEAGDAEDMDLFLDSTRNLVGEQKDVTGTLQALFTETVKAVGDYGPGRRRVKLFDGTEVPTDSYGRPDAVFTLIDDALSDGSQAGRNFKQLADAAGVTQDQLETLHSVFRLSFQIQGERLVADAASGTLKQTTKGFTLDNALSKAFNIARGMVSTEYVMAEVGIRYAALARGKTLEFLIKDPRSAEIVRNLLNDPTNVVESDALYFAQKIMKFVASDVPRELLEMDVAENDYAMKYWKSQGMVFDVDSRGDPIN